MEVILSVLDAIVNPTQKSRDLGPSMIYMSQLANNSYSGGIPTISELQTIKKSIEDLIINSCNNFDFERAKEYYRSLFNFENSVTPFYVNAKNEHPRIPIFSHTVTTNYDLVLERYDKECDTDSTLPAKHFLRRGFIRPYNEAEPELRIGEMDPKLEYLKLHGSVDWWIRKRDGRIIARDCFHSLMGEIYEGRLMIYPVYDKKVSRDPFSSLYNHFRQLLSLHEAYIVIGYSFRDSSINDAFADALNNRNETRIIIVNRDPDRILSKIQNFPRRKIDIITTPFGQNALIDELNQLIRGTPVGF